MPRELDVYRDWLGITDTSRPLDHYQLLRLKRFDDDAARIRDRYKRMNAHVRKFASGDYARPSQQLLNELAKAMLCLTDTQRKREYDASLGRKDAGSGRRRSVEEILLSSKALDTAQLAKARGFADVVGLEVREAIVQQKLAPADVVMQAYAESIGLPYVDPADVPIDEAIAAAAPPTLVRQHSCVPLLIDEGRLLVASPHPLTPQVEEEFRLRNDVRAVATVITTPANVSALMARFYPLGGKR